MMITIQVQTGCDPGHKGSAARAGLNVCRHGKTNRWRKGLMRVIRTVLGVMACSLLLTAPVSAQLKGNPDNWCRNGLFPRESKDYRLARIKGAAGDKVHFRDDNHERCPADQSCQAKGYVIPNDQILVSRTFDKYACSWFQPRKGHETVGWIEIDRLAWVDVSRQPAEQAWLGEWRHHDNVIRLAKAKAPGEFTITGEAIWGSGAQAHTGELDYTAKPSGDKLNFNDGPHENDCQVSMQLVGPYLVVGDNVRCGGANVSFSGVYQKRSKQ
jgi:hypothetical protein